MIGEAAVEDELPKDQTLQEHDRQHHPDGYHEGDTCKFREKMATETETDKADVENPDSVPKEGATDKDSSSKAIATPQGKGLLEAVANQVKGFLKGVTIKISNEPYQKTEDDARKSIKESEQANWNRILDAFEKKTAEADATFHHRLLAHTPAVLRRLGVKDLPITIMGGVIHKMIGTIRNSEYDYHEIPISELRNLLIDLDNPVAVFESASDPNAIVVLTNILDRHGNLKSVVPLKLDRAASGTARENVIASAYGQKQKNLQEWIDEGRLLYVSKKALRKSAQRLQLPRDSILKTHGVLMEDAFSSEQLGEIIPDLPSDVKGAKGKKEEAKEVINFRDSQGKVVGTYNRKTNDVVLYDGAEADTIGHELCGHATWQYAEQQAKKGDGRLLEKMQEVVDAPAAQPVWDEVKASYEGEDREVQREEVWAHIIGHRTSKAIEEIQKSRSGRRWYQKFWNVVKDAWKGLLSTIRINTVHLEGIEEMSPKEFSDYIVKQMLERRTLGELDKRKGDDGERKSISKVFTGSAANYDKPSLLHIGEGEGSQVYGWGLYGSTVRGVAEGYANFEGSKQLKNPAKAEAGKYLALENGDVGKAIDRIRAALKPPYRVMPKEVGEEAIRLLESGEVKGVGNLYEQTFFTDRAEGDESHLLKWEEQIGVQKLKDITAALPLKKQKIFRSWLRDSLPYGTKPQHAWGQDVYKALSNTLEGPKSASEFLRDKLGYDGVKYPVGSFGSLHKQDGDKVGWNYVSFRDDNIQIDKKYVDGQKVYDYQELMAKHPGIDAMEVLSRLTKLGDREEMAAEFKRIIEGDTAK